MSLLHAFTVLLTVLLFVARLRRALLALYTGKRGSLRQQGSQHEWCAKPAPVGHSSEDWALTQLALFLTEPKYKRDPDIDVDSEEIGYEPLL